ncbi:hypothetical protein GWI33_014559 [Rhynchophorus ferrugineus]|uniref:Uncharacterized protein n=1 Tax=Rhynchophorus ferrugineus TaxID=354439 RepID=A0A834M5D9_RHYFE|nr:hypothetical protein GWI33_014559 [Rhynchophorus ferrugineus]
MVVLCGIVRLPICMANDVRKNRNAGLGVVCDCLKNKTFTSEDNNRHSHRVFASEAGASREIGQQPARSRGKRGEGGGDPPSLAGTASGDGTPVPQFARSLLLDLSYRRPTAAPSLCRRATRTRPRKPDETSFLPGK